MDFGLELVRKCGSIFDTDQITLTKMEYEELLIRLEDDYYVPTELELNAIFYSGKDSFFIARRNNINYLIYIDDNKIIN